MAAAGPMVKTSLFPVAFSNCGPSSSRTAFKAVELKTLISAACACAAAKANIKPTSAAIPRRMPMAPLPFAGFDDRLWEASVAIGAGDCQEFGRVEAGTADKSTVDIFDSQQLSGVRRLDRPAVENAHIVPRLAEAHIQTSANEVVNVADIAWRRRLSAADRPYRLIGDDDIGRRVHIGFRQRSVKLATDDV